MQVVKEITVLIVEDCASDRAAYSRYLERMNYSRYRFVEAETIKAAIPLWQSCQPDLVLLDIKLPDGDGLDLLRHVEQQAKSSAVAVIVLTGLWQEDLGIKALHLGVEDFIIKDRLTEWALQHSVIKALEKQRINQESRDTQAVQKALIKALPDLVIRMDRTGKYLSVETNPNFPLIRNVEALRCKNIRDLPIPSEEIERRLAATQLALSSGKTQEYEFPLQVGDQCRWQEMRISPICSNEVLLIIRDVTAKKLSEFALKEFNHSLEATVQQRTATLQARETEIRTMMETIPDLIVRVTRDGRCLDYFQSKSLANIFPVPYRHLSEMLPQRMFEQQVQAIEVAIVTGQLQIHEQQLQRDGVTHYEEVRTARLNAHEAIVIIRDISERKQAELQLRQKNEELAHATKLKDEFLANMSHELRTPLNAILGMAEALQENIFGETNSKQQDAIALIEKSGLHLLDLINDILDLAKIEAGQVVLDYAETDVTRLCESSFAFIQQQAIRKRVQLATAIAPNLPSLWVDERRLRQVLLNLLNNAVKFTPAGGQITLEAKIVSPAPTETLTDADSEAIAPSALLIAVADTGIGIAAADMKRLFQPFVQIDSAFNRKYMGTGLGLSLVKHIVELHGGTVEVASRIGDGSRFSILLPLTMATSDPRVENQISTGMEAIQQIAAPSQQPITVLLVEDNEASISTVSSYLKARGYDCAIARNGREALAQAQQVAPDVILMDIQMPEMDGLTAMRQIRAEVGLSDVPIVALTALAMAEDQTKCLAAGATAYMSKPMKLKELHHLIQQLVKAAQTPMNLEA